MISLLTSLGLAALAAADKPPPARHDLDALLARPVSSGVVALLVPHLASERASADVIASLTHADPAVRAAAARVAYVADLRDGESGVRSALEAETDRSAAVEQLRAAALWAPPGGASALLSIATKHGALRQLAEAGPGARAPASRPAGGGSPADAATYDRLLIAGGLPSGMLRDILAVTGCKPAGELRAAGIVNYRTDGRPQRASVAADHLSPACAEAAVAAVGLTLAPSGFVDPGHPERRTVVYVPFDPEALECADQPEPSVVERVDTLMRERRIAEPRKVKNVAPDYPATARKAGRQGTVILEASIAETGCIRFARVVRGVSPELDTAALVAVGQWRYRPTVLEGSAVNVIMTVTVSFRLSFRLER